LGDRYEKPASMAVPARAVQDPGKVIQTVDQVLLKRRRPAGRSRRIRFQDWSVGRCQALEARIM
jgi:hypothetical protein